MNCVTKNMNDISEYCENPIQAEDINIFKQPFRLLIIGGSNSGKSYLCSKILEFYESHYDVIILAKSPNKQPIQDIDILKEKNHVYKEIPSLDEINSKFSKKKKKVIYLDDNYYHAFSNENVLNYFIHGRHSNVSVILVVHNLFFNKNSYARDISLNSSLFLFMKNRDKNQIYYLANQLYGKNTAKNVIAIYDFIVAKYKYPHLLIDASINIKPELEFRSNIIPDHNISKFECCYSIL